MWLYRQIKEHPSLVIGVVFLLGGAVAFLFPFPVLYLMTTAWAIYTITAVICLVAGLSLDRCLGWLADRGNRNPNSPSVSPLPLTRVPATHSIALAQGRSHTVVLKLQQDSKRDEVKEEKQVVARKKTEDEDLTDVLRDIIIDYVGGDFGDSKTTFSPAYFGTHCTFFMTTKGRQYNRAEAIVFLLYIVKGEQEKAKAMLENNATLLFCTEVVTDYSGRRIKGTAYQIALGAEDIEMVSMILPYFRMACDNNEEQAQEEINRQYHAQFTLESEQIEEKNAAADNEALCKVIQAIRIASAEDCQFLLDKKNSERKGVKIIDAELKQFRAYLDSKTAKVITARKHFNANLLVAAFNQYDANYDAFQTPDNSKNNLFWRQVIGYIQRYLPTCYAQAFCLGIYYIVYQGKSLPRSLQFYFSCNDYFFPLPEGESGLGYEYAIAGAGPAFAACERGNIYDLYVRQKQAQLGALMQDPASTSQP